VLKTVCICLLLITWAWIGGFAFGSLARRLAWIHPLLISFLLWFFRYPLSVAFVRPPQPEQIPIADFILWMLAAVLLILLPLLAGVHYGSRRVAISLRRGVLLAVGLAMLTLMVQIEGARTAIDIDVWASGRSMDGRWVWKPQLFPFAAIFWQLGVVGVISRWQRRGAAVNAS
jgi:hypothetical protein